MTTEEKLEVLRNLVEVETIARLIRDGVGCEANQEHAKTHLHIGKKYVRLDDKTSGKLMIEIATGAIFGIKAYGVIHRGHPYGTLDTISEWDWGNYYPRKKTPVLTA